MDDVRIAAGAAPPPGEASDAIVSQTKASRWWGAMTVALFAVSVGGTFALGQPPWVMAAIMFPALATGVLAQRWKVEADSGGVTVTNMFNRKHIRWQNLTGIHLEEVQGAVSFGFVRPVLTYRIGDRERTVRPEGHSGRPLPGLPHYELVRTLLGMWDRQVPAPDGSSRLRAFDAEEARLDAEDNQDVDSGPGPR